MGFFYKIKKKCSESTYKLMSMVSTLVLYLEGDDKKQLV